MVKIDTRICVGAAGGKNVLADGLRHGSSSDSKKGYRLNVHSPFRLKIEHVVCASVRAVSTVFSGQTATLERVLQAPAQYSICGWGEFACYMGVRGGTARLLSIVTRYGTWHKQRGGEIVGMQHHVPKGRAFEPRSANILAASEVAPSTTTSWSPAHQHLKAAEPHLSKLIKNEQGSGVS